MKPLRAISDAIVDALATRGHDNEGWCSQPWLKERTGLTAGELCQSTIFLRDEYGVVETVGPFVAGGLKPAWSARLVRDRLDDYYAGDAHNRPGRLHHPAHAWHNER